MWGPICHGHTNHYCISIAPRGPPPPAPARHPLRLTYALHTHATPCASPMHSLHCTRHPQDREDLDFLYAEWAHPYFISIEQFCRLMNVSVTEGGGTV